MKRLVSWFLVMSVVMLLGAERTWAQGLVSKQSLGEKKVLVVMIRFPDVVPQFSPEAMKEKYFEKLNRYVRSMSLDRTRLTGRVTDWYTLPKPVSQYRISQHNLGVDRRKIETLIDDGLRLAAQDHDLKQYQIVFLSLGARREDYGMMGLCGYPGMLGWSGPAPKGVGSLEGVAIYCEPAHLGVVFHDLAHILGGVQEDRRVVPCLYDHDLQGQPGPFRNFAQFYLTNVGYFDPMSCHYVDLKQGPPGLSSWTRLRLGWLPPSKVLEIPKGKPFRFTLGPLTDGRSPTLAARVRLDKDVYYLFENRQALGADQCLPSFGLLVYRADDRTLECRRGLTPVLAVNADPSVPELRAAPLTMKGRKEYENQNDGFKVRLLGQKGLNLEVEATMNP
jgi:hypothetical protein